MTAFNHYRNYCLHYTTKAKGNITNCFWETVRLRSPPVGFLKHTPPVGNLRLRVFCLTYPTSDISARKPGLDTAVIEVGSGSSAQQQQCAAAAVRGGNSARQCPAASRVSSQQPGTHPQNPSASPQPIGSRNPRGAFLRSCGTAALLLALLLRHTTPHLCRSCFWCVSDGTFTRRRDHGDHGRATVGARACYAGLCAVPTDHQGHVWDSGGVTKP